MGVWFTIACSLLWGVVYYGVWFNEHLKLKLKFGCKGLCKSPRVGEGGGGKSKRERITAPSAPTPPSMSYDIPTHVLVTLIACQSVNSCQRKNKGNADGLSQDQGSRFKDGGMSEKQQHIKMLTDN